MSVRLEGIILRRKTLREHDLLLSVFSRSEGRLLLVKEKALKKPQAELDLFCRNEFILAGLQDFTAIYQVSGLDMFVNLRRSYALLQEAANAVKTAEKITAPLQPNPKLYALLAGFLETLNQTAPDKTALKQLRLNWYADILHCEGLYDGKPVTEKSFQLAVVNYRG